jgi:glycosyltransferase involved in cell wall biosynthesis
MTVVARPLLGNWHFRRDVPTFLMVAYWDPCNISTIPAYVAAWQEASRFNVAVLNLWPGSGGPLAIPSSVDLDDFDGVILHPTVAYFPANLFGLDTRIAKRFDEYEGLKILLKQDEHVQSARWAEFIATKCFDILVTCLSSDQVQKVYPREILPDVEIVHALPGYVPPYFRGLPFRPLSQRSIDISYRGSLQPLAVGLLGFEKRQIGYAVERAASVKRCLRMDISSRWEDRITGSGWLEFLASSRIVLGTESGSRLFDFDGVVERWCQDYLARNTHLDPYGEEIYRAAHEEFLHRLEGNVDNATVSPRHFEAAATRSVQLLYEGRYAGIFEPYRHYLPLKRDLSNLDELLDLARDERKAALMTEAAFEEIVQVDRFTYRYFVSEIDDAIDRLLADRRPQRAVSAPQTGKPRALLLMSHDPVLDPRIDWVSKGLLAQGFDVVELGTYRFSVVGAGPSLETLADGRPRIRVERTRHDFAFAPNPQEIERGLSVGQQQLLAIHAIMSLPEAARRQRIGAIDFDQNAPAQFASLCDYVINTNSALIQAARQTGVFDIVAVADLDVLPAGETLAKDFGAILVYDSHEYFPHSYHMARHWERDFWTGIERALVPHADLRLTVSPPLAAQLSQDYGVPFLSVPNCEPLSSELGHNPPTDRSQQVIFLFQGGFAPGRNIERLIRQWPSTDERAILWLRGPNWSYRHELIEIAKSTGLFGSRILFPPAVTEAELVSAAAQAHVGIIPYDHTDNANKYACPNKMSQYLAAGLPILSTEIEFVASLVRSHDLGTVFSFTSQPSLADGVNVFVQDRAGLAARSARAREFFTRRFHWEAVSKGFYAELNALFAARTRSPLAAEPLDLSWIEAGRTMRRSVIVPQSQPRSHPLSSFSGYGEPFGLRVLGAIPKRWRTRIRGLLPERLVSAILSRLQ